MTTPLDAQSLHGTSPDGVPWRDWASVADYVDKTWDPENTPHHSIVGLTGSGKSYLAINGILKKTCPWDRVLIFDVKRDDKLVSSTGRAVKEVPATDAWYMNRNQRRKYDRWFRIPVPYDRDQARQVVHTALHKVFHEGGWVLYFDELHYVTSNESTDFLGLRGPVEKIYRLGRNKHISIVAATQSPRYVPPSFYDQASFAWIGHIRDEQRQKRLLEIGGMSRKELPYIASLKRREWLLTADSGDYFARTTVTV